MKNAYRVAKCALLFACCIAGAALAGHARADVIYNVNSTVDQIDDDVTDGECHTAANTCTLRAAIMQANHLTGQITTRIKLPAGTYLMTRAAVGTNGEASGDLNFTSPLTGGQIISIEGTSAASSVIDANQIDRVMNIDQNRVVSLSKVTIRDGQTAAYGGGIFSRGNLKILDSIIENNASGLNGGGISGTDLNIQRCTFRSNISGNYGGAIYVTGSTSAFIRESTFYGNAARAGGAISTEVNSSSFIINSTISSNTANIDGGGIVNYGSTFIYNTSIIANDADHDHAAPAGVGGGFYNPPGKRFLANNSLIANNTTLNSPVPDDCNGLLEAYGWNLLDDYGGCSFSGNGSVARGHVSITSIASLADNGGPTLTHALVAGSEAIDTAPAPGCIDSAGVLLSSDQRGAPRIAGPKCDVGAYEYGSVVPPVDTIFRDGFE